MLILPVAVCCFLYLILEIKFSCYCYPTLVFFFTYQLLSRRQLVIFGKDLKTYTQALLQTIQKKNFSSEGSGDRRHPQVIVLLEDCDEGNCCFFTIIYIYFFNLHYIKFIKFI